MTTPPMPTGQTTFQRGATYAADGVTRLTASSAASLVSTPSATDPPLLVSTNIYGSRVPDGTNYPATEMVLLFEAGQVVKTSQWNAAFPLAIVASLSPATGTHLGGTVVTVTGQNFTPGTTVTVGGSAATAVTITAPDLMTFTTPAVAAGTVNVVITNDGGALTLTGAFVYT